MPILESIGSFLGSGLGSTASSIGSTLFNRRAERKERQHQEAWEASRYQTAAKDMEAAGLNRILALGSSAGSIAQADVGGMDTAGAHATGAETARKASMTALEKEYLNEQIDTLLNQQQGINAAAKRDFAQAKVNEATEQSIQLENERRRVISKMFEEMGPAAIFFESLLGEGGGGTAKGIFDLLRGKK